MKKISTIQWIEIFFVAAVIIIALINVFCIKNSEFWEISIAQVLTLLVAIVVAFWAGQRRTDLRKIKSQMEEILEKVQMIVSAREFVVFTAFEDSEDVKKRITMTNRRLTNYINILEEYSKTFDISEEITYINNEFKGYRDFMSEKVGDLDYLSKSETPLRRYAENISSKYDYIILKLYTKL